MNAWTRRTALTASLALMAGLSACGGGGSDLPNLLTLAKQDSRLSILAEAVAAAGLESALTGSSARTLLAPTDAAFASLLAELGVDKATLLSNKALLTTVLSYHLIDGSVKAADVPLGKAIEPTTGGVFKIDEAEGELVITDGRNRSAKITQTDLRADNGVVHVIDRVLLPANRNVVETAQALAAGSPPQFTVLVDAIVAAGLVDTLSGTGPFTVFAPTDAAFADLLDELGVTREQLLANTELLTQVLTYHVVPGRVLKADIEADAAVTTVEGGTFSISVDAVITDARDRQSSIVATDTLASNGVIHVIDKVLLPAAPQ